MTYKVLIVDDEPDLRESVGYLLERAGFEIECASNGHEGIGAAHAFQPDLVLLDVMMPKENGYRVSRRMHEAQACGLLPEAMKVCLLTARKLDHDPERESLFNDFARPDAVMYKPFDPQQLIDKVSEMLGTPVTSPA
ncbi:MAG: response regulator [Nitrospirota bacterium]|nr:response regulator [Nitrospirota bacterium]